MRPHPLCIYVHGTTLLTREMAKKYEQNIFVNFPVVFILNNADILCNLITYKDSNLWGIFGHLGKTYGLTKFSTRVPNYLCELRGCVKLYV